MYTSIPETVLDPRATTLKIQPLPRVPEIILALDFNDRRIPNFHWFLFIPDHDISGKTAVQSGHKIHAKIDQSVRDTRRWVFESTPFNLATSTSSLATAAVIGHFEYGKTFRDLERLLARVPLSVPYADVGREKEFTCRVWIRQALRVMHAAGLIYCPRVNALEDEMKRYGKAAQKALLKREFKFARLIHAENSRTL